MNLIRKLLHQKRNTTASLLYKDIGQTVATPDCGE